MIVSRCLVGCLRPRSRPLQRFSYCQLHSLPRTAACAAAAPQRLIASLSFRSARSGGDVSGMRPSRGSAGPIRRQASRTFASASPRPDIIEVLRSRGLLDAVTNEEALHKMALERPLRAYCGFDPTADSLHLGNLLGVIVLAHFQRCGHFPVALVGGATGRVGDPSGKSTERPVLPESVIEGNVAAIAALLDRLLRNAAALHPSPHAAGAQAGSASAQEGSASAQEGYASAQRVEVVNNIEWFGGMGLLAFLRECGKFARVGVMLSKDSVKSRMGGDDAEGMSYTEFTYQLLQAYDFMHLFMTKDVAVQWGNITAGTDLIRRVHQRDGAFGVTFPLLLRSDGKKFGKSEEGAIWLTADKLSPYKFYQYMFATPDADVPRFLRTLTFLPLDEIAAIERGMGDAASYEVNSAQRRLASELTLLVHGEEGLQQALRATEGLKPGAATKLDAAALEAIAGDVPSVTLRRDQVVGAPLAELIAAAGLQPTKSAAKRLIGGGGVYLNNERVPAEGAVVSESDCLGGRMLLLQSGKKNKLLVRIE